MNFIEIGLKDAYIIEPNKIEDQRGFFTRVFDEKEFKKRGLNNHIIQSNCSVSKNKGTLRGLHFQIKPHEESKLIRCTKGKIFDVIIDIRENSPTFMKWKSALLDSSKHNMIYVPEGFAHGFQTLEDNTEVFYHVSHEYFPGFESGIRYDDDSFCIKWPIEDPIISNKDQSWKAFDTRQT
jgi:dTDP-4-dehydrorhamnose 3,5-epimerase